MQPKNNSQSLDNNMKHMSDLDRIIDGCLKRDRKMQKELYDKYSARMYAICLRYANDRAEADDMLQEGFLKILTKIDQFSREHSFEGWMKRVIINSSITHYKQNLKHYYQQDIDEVNENEIEGNEYSECEFTKEELLKVIQEISEGYRTVFNLYAIEGFKHQEIADMLGIDVATSKSQFHRAKKIIQSRLIKLSGVKLLKVDTDEN